MNHVVRVHAPDRKVPSLRLASILELEIARALEATNRLRERAGHGLAEPAGLKTEAAHLAGVWKS